MVYMLYICMSLNFSLTTCHKLAAGFWRFGIDKLNRAKRHHRIASIGNNISISNSSSGCSLITVNASRLCQTCVSVCGNNVSWVFRSCLVNVVRHDGDDDDVDDDVISINSSITTSGNSGNRQLSVCLGRLECCDAADDAPYMLSMLSALRLKSAIGGSRDEEIQRGWRVLEKSGKC